MLKFLEALAALLTILAGAFQKASKQKEQEHAQQEAAAADENPAGWFDARFNGSIGGVLDAAAVSRTAKDADPSNTEKSETQH